MQYTAYTVAIMNAKNLPEPVKVPLVNEPWGIWRTLKTARRNVLEILPEISTTQPIVSGKTGKRWHMVMDPDTLRHILKDGLKNYPKSDVTKNILRPAIGESLFVAEGAHWHWQRRAAAPAFALRNIQNLAPIMSLAAEHTITRLEKSNAQLTDMYEQMTATTFQVISDVTFSGGAGFDGDEIHQAIDNYIEQTAKISLMDMIGVPMWIPRPSRLFTSNSLKMMKKVSDAAIESRKSTGPANIPDLLDLLLAGEDPETKRKMDTKELRDNLLTFIVAGHETTALTLAWALYLCAFDPRVQALASTQARQVLQGRTATAKDVERLTLTRQIIDETLRLYPPAAFLARTAQADDKFLGRAIKARDTVMLPIYALHRNHLLWDNPDAFKPERFSDPKTIDKFAYLPFGAGPRVCIGANFAIQESVIILASILSRFTFSPVKGKEPKPVMILTLRPSGGGWLKAQPIQYK